jgi:type I restriction enzyme S subunit
MKENWTYKKLGEVCELEYGTRVVQARDGGSIYPVYGGGGATFKMDLYNRENRVVVSRFAMSTKCTRKVNGKFFLNDSGLTIKSVDVTLSQIYLDTCILALNDKIYSLGRGAAQKNLKVTDLVNIPIPIPPMEEQERIVAELDLLQSVIDKKKAQLDEYDKLAQSIFYEMFGDPIDNPKKWEVKKLGEVCEVSSSKRVLIEDVVESGVPFIRGTELTALSKLVHGEKMKYTLFITKEHYERLKAITGVPKIGDLLIPSINSNGIVWMVDTAEPLYFKDGRVLWVHVNNDAFVSCFLQREMQLLIKNIFSSMNGATFAELKLFVLRDLPIPLPPLSFQQSFAEKIEAIEHQKELVKQSLNEVKTLFDSRMDYYFN